MKIIIKPSVSEGEIIANPSKSCMQRAIAIAAYYQSRLLITNPCLSADCKAAISVAEAMGCIVLMENEKLTIIPNKGAYKDIWQVGESGLSARMFGVLAAFTDRKITIAGQGSILKRPLKDLDQVYGQLMIDHQWIGKKLPVTVKGPVKNFNLEIDGSESSQSLTGLLIALPKNAEDSLIRVNNLKSTPYTDLTIQMLNDFGINIQQHDHQTFSIQGGQIPDLQEYSIEGDWSGASFLLVSAAIGGKVNIAGLNINSVQGDKNIMEVLKRVGAKVEIQPEYVTVSKHELRAFSYDATQTPDLFPPLVALAAFCSGTSRIKGVNRLVHKESNRFVTLKAEFNRIGVEIEQEDDWMIIKPAELKSAKVFSHADHRIAMALAVLGMHSGHEIEIDGFECTNKSYPNFLRDLGQLGASYEILEA